MAPGTCACSGHRPAVSRPTLVTFALITVVAKWNEYLWPLLVATDDRVTLRGLTQLQNSEGSTQWGHRRRRGAGHRASGAVPLAHATSRSLGRSRG